jgi:hypothetical protein
VDTLAGEEGQAGISEIGDAFQGPRHAAPRRSFLTKLQIPAGKAMALAAMPTAVFVGMGLTPKLAQAEELPSNPFAPGPCVTRSDEPPQDASPSPSESAAPSATSSPEPAPSKTRSLSRSSAVDRSQPAESSSPAEPADGPSTEQQEASPDPTTSQEPNLLDPLGVGDLLGTSSEEPTTGETSSSPAPEPSSTTTAPSGAPDSSGSSGAAATTDKTVQDAQEKTAKAIREAADKVGAKVEDVAKGAKGTKESAKPLATTGDGGTTDGKEPFPCPTHDAEALAAADLEPGIPLLPDEPWRLESSRLTLYGLEYHGIVEVKTYSGKIKKVLKFTADAADIKDLHQLVDGPQGTTTHVKGAAGTTSTIRDGTVTMYTEELKGKLFGLTPITFSPDTPPPVNVPEAFFTDVHVRQAGQFGGTLTIDGMNLYSTSG